MPPTARWPFSCTMPRASAPFRNSPSSFESARVNGMFMRERWDKAALFLQPLEHGAGDVPGVGRRGVGRCRSSVEWLYLHDPVVVVAADPERRRRGRLVDEH